MRGPHYERTHYMRTHCTILYYIPIEKEKLAKVESGPTPFRSNPYHFYDSRIFCVFLMECMSYLTDPSTKYQRICLGKKIIFIEGKIVRREVSRVIVNQLFLNPHYVRTYNIYVIAQKNMISFQEVFFGWSIYPRR